LKKNINGKEIKALREKLNLSQTDFALKIGKSLRSIQMYEQGNTLPSGESLLILLNLMEDNKQNNAEFKNSYESNETDFNNMINKVLLKEGLPLIPVNAMAGIASGEISILELDCERFIIPTFKGADYLINVKGSSMYPKYNSGDIVACKKVPLKDIFFQWNKVYVIDTNQGALIKRIQEGDNETNIMLVSDNEKYKPFQVRKEDIHAIAIVMGVIRME
jgi:phage repressor protein C with HTH and peptisase S24 domain